MDPKKPPRDGKLYRCTIEHCTNGQRVHETLKAVCEDDCDWRTADDNSPVSYDWDVVSWQFENDSSK